MAPLHKTPEPSAETLAERLARTRRPGDEFGQGGWHHQSSTIAPPEPPGLFLVLLPFLVLIVVAVALTIGLLVIASQS